MWLASELFLHVYRWVELEVDCAICANSSHHARPGSWSAFKKKTVEEEREKIKVEERASNRKQHGEENSFFGMTKTDFIFTQLKELNILREVDKNEKWRVI